MTDTTEIEEECDAMNIDLFLQLSRCLYKRGVIGRALRTLPAGSEDMEEFGRAMICSGAAMLVNSAGPSAAVRTLQHVAEMADSE